VEGFVSKIIRNGSHKPVVLKNRFIKVKLSNIPQPHVFVLSQKGYLPFCLLFVGISSSFAEENGKTAPF